MDSGITEVFEDVFTGTADAINDYIVYLVARGATVIDVQTTPTAEGEPWFTARINYTEGAEPAAGVGTATEPR